MAKLALALLCAALALATARQLHQTGLMELTQLPQTLQDLNAHMSAAVSNKVSTMSLLDSYDLYSKLDKHGKYVPKSKYDEPKYEPKYAPEYEPKYGEPKYDASGPKYDGPKYEEPKYDAPKYDAPKYDGYKEEKYDGPKYEAPKYEAPKYDAPKYEGEHKYEPKYDSYEKESYGYDSYGPSKVSVKLFEKHRSKARVQEGNANTFQFTSELTCTDPAHVKEIEKDDGVIGFPISSPRMNLVTVGQCEWTVTMVKAQQISEHAKLKGSTNVICRFNEEAERHCKTASEILCDGMTVSGQGLVYEFEAMEQEKSYYAKDAAQPEVAKKEYEPEAESMDVYLTLINGVINAKKHMKWDNGAMQYFYGETKEEAYARDVTTSYGSAAKGNPTGQLTLVFKGGKGY